MSIKNIEPRKIKPTHPGEMLREDFMPDYNLTTSRLAEMLGVSRQTVVLAYQMGDGFSNLLWPTHPLLMIGLGFAGIRYTKWIKWVWPLHLLVLAICVCFLVLAVEIGY